MVENVLHTNNLDQELKDLANPRAKNDKDYLVELYRLLQDTTALRLSLES